jgi:hypothetical protein
MISKISESDGVHSRFPGWGGDHEATRESVELEPPRKYQHLRLLGRYSELKLSRFWELRNSSILLPMQVPSSEIFKVIPSFFPSRKHHAERRKPEVLVPAKGVEDLQSDQAKSEQEQVKRKKGEKKEGRVKNSEFFSAVKSLSPATTRRRKRRRRRRLIRFNSFSVFCRLDCWGGEGEFDHF